MLEAKAMGRRKYEHLSGGLFGLLAYHALLVLAAAYLAVTFGHDASSRAANNPWDVWEVAVAVAFAGFAFALSLASWGIIAGDPRGVLLGLVCELVPIGVALACCLGRV